jgi:MFS family permease
MRRSTIAAAGLAGLTLACFTYSSLAGLVPTRADAPGTDVSPLEVVFVLVFILGTVAIGGLIAVRRPGNPTGWLFLVLVLGFAASFASDDFVRRSQPDALAGWIGIIGSSLGGLGFLGLYLLLMLFPTGHLPSRRWRWLPIVAVAGVAASTVVSLFSPGSTGTPPVPGLVNPLGQPGWQSQLEVVNRVAVLCFSVAVVGSISLLVVRVRRSRGTERQQLKWFVWAASVPAALIVGVVLSGVAGDTGLGNALWVLAISSFALLPIAAAIAILRNQLFDIDRLISRTVSYAGVTAILGGVFVGAILILQAVLAPMTRSNTLAVAGSTLVVAALFQPLRRRIQAATDRRFNRSRFDAQQIAEAFAGRIRDEVDLGRLRAEVARIVEQTIQPERVAVWLRETRH